VVYVGHAESAKERTARFLQCATSTMALRPSVRWLAPLLVLLGATAAFAAKRDGVEMPDRIQVDGSSLVLNGLGTREATILNINVYVAGLYLEKRSSDPTAIIASEQAKRLVLHFVRDVDRDDITGAWTEGFEKNARKDQRAKLNARIEQLNGWMSAMKDGEQLMFTYAPGRGISVTVKGVTRGTISGSDFARVFLSIWLGPHPPNQGLKDGLLGKR